MWSVLTGRFQPFATCKSAVRQHWNASECGRRRSVPKPLVHHLPGIIRSLRQPPMLRNTVFVLPGENANLQWRETRRSQSFSTLSLASMSYCGCSIQGPIMPSVSASHHAVAISSALHSDVPQYKTFPVSIRSLNVQTVSSMRVLRSGRWA